jgi:hypothetical protein
MKLTTLIILIACIALPMLALAQPGFGNDTMDTPIDGGVSLLIAGAIGYGAKKMKDRKKASGKDNAGK